MRTVLLVGLGNPGASYAANRHNVGFMAVDHIAGEYGFSRWNSKSGALLSEGKLDGLKAVAMKPMGYMNNSGQPVGDYCRFYKIPPEDVYVIHDELDLPLAKLRVKQGGGHGGHNALRSLDAHIGQNYHRLRFGIGHPGDKDLVSDYVLSDFRKEERPATEGLIKDIARHLPLLLHGDAAGFMNKLTLATKEK